MSDPVKQTERLRERLDTLRHTGDVVLSFTGVDTMFAVHHSDTLLRLGDCSYNVTSDVSGLIDLLLAAKVGVGYPVGKESYLPEARFGVFFDVDQGRELDLWFSNPLAFDRSSDLMVVGQSHDRLDVTAYRISAAGTLRDALWKWVSLHGYPRPETAEVCQELKKYDTPH